MLKSNQLGVDKRIEYINHLILYYSELREKGKSKTEQESYERMISLLVNQKIRIQEFYSKTS